MRPTHLPLPRLRPTITLPGSSRREAAEKSVAEPPAPKKRCLNEAAHKLDR